MRYPIVAVMRAAGETIHGQSLRALRALIVVLWRAGLRISETLALAEPDLDARRGAVLVRRGKGGPSRGRDDDRAWEHLQHWMTARLELPGRPAVLHRHRPDARLAVVGLGRSHTATGDRGCR
jgi:integrase